MGNYFDFIIKFIDEDFISLAFSGIAAISTGVAAIFSYIAVKNASKSNEIALKQYKESVELNRPVLDVATKHYKGDTTESVLIDWDKDDNAFIPKYASYSYIELNNIGRNTARNVSVSFEYEGLDLVNELLPIDNNERDENQILKLYVENKIESDLTFEQYSILEKRYLSDGREKFKWHYLKNLSYEVRLGSVQPANGGNAMSTRIYLPKLFVYLNNAFVEQIINDDFKIFLIINVKYADALQNKYIQRFKIENFIRNYTFGSKNHLIGQLIPEEIDNLVIENN